MYLVPVPSSALQRHTIPTEFLVRGRMEEPLNIFLPSRPFPSFPSFPSKIPRFPFLPHLIMAGGPVQPQSIVSVILNSSLA